MTVQICKSNLINRHFTYYYQVKSVCIFRNLMYLCFEDHKLEKVKLDTSVEYLIS